LLTLFQQRIHARDIWLLLTLPLAQQRVLAGRRHAA
jgi:hypothetical protein